jgi:hypothetical protein
MAPRWLEFKQEIADIIFDRLMDGESLRGICKDEDMPPKIAVLKWLQAYPLFQTQYARAREIQADALFDETLDIANTPHPGVITVTKPSGVEVTLKDMIEHRRLQIDTRKWIAGKLRPKKYGERIGTDETGDNAENITRVVGGFAEAFKPE